MNNPTEIVYQEVDLNTVMKYFMDGFKGTKENKILDYGQEWYLDTIKQKVVFRFLVEKNNE